MTTEFDPEGVEPKYLFDMVDLAQTRVLEISAGDGRLTWRYAAAARHVIGIDPDPARLTTARCDHPPALQSKVAFTHAEAEVLPFPDESFDLALLAWSL